MFSTENLEYISSLTENLEKLYQNEIADFPTYEAHYFDIVDDIQKVTVTKRQLLSQIDEEKRKQENFEKDTNETRMHIENLQRSIEKLERVLSKKQVEANELEEGVASLKAKLQSVVNEKENLTKLRQEILTYKLLTRVDLIFSSKNVTGLIIKDVPKPFRFDPKKMDKEEIIEKIWELILEK